MPRQSAMEEREKNPSSIKMRKSWLACMHPPSFYASNTPLAVRWLDKWSGKKNEGRLSDYSLIWGWGGREYHWIFKEVPWRSSWANKVHANEARTFKAAIVAHGDSAELIWLASWHSFPAFSLEESRERPLPRRRLRARDVICSHTNTHM